MTIIELKGRTPEEKGHHYLQLSLTALKELANLLEDKRLSTSDKTVYHEAYQSNVDSYDDMVRLRDRILAQKKSIFKFIINLFVRETDVQRYHKATYRNYAAIKRTSDDLSRRLLPNKNDILGSLRGSTQGHATIYEESPPDGVVEGGLPVTDPPPDETIRGICIEAHGEEEEQEVLEMVNRLTELGEGNEDEDDDRTIRPSHSQSRPPSPSPSCIITYNNFHINQSVVSFDSESNGTTLNIGVDEGVGSSSNWHADTTQLSE